MAMVKGEWRMANGIGYGDGDGDGTCHLAYEAHRRHWRWGLVHCEWQIAKGIDIIEWQTVNQQSDHSEEQTDGERVEHVDTHSSIASFFLTCFTRGL